jgi:molybdopterin converting factor subunit 1
MIVRVHLFARAKDLAGTALVTLDLAASASVADLRRRLAQQYPALAPLLEHSALAVNQEFAPDELLLPDNAEIALLPPVSGG